MSDSKIIDKIAKLLALAAEDSGATEAERNLAQDNAQKLMLKHNIDFARVTGSKQSAEGDVGADHEVHITGAMNQWKVQLYWATSTPLFVKALRYKTAKHGARILFVGRPDNVAFVTTLCEHLIPWLEEECKQASKLEEQNRNGAFFNPRAFKRAFMQSAVWKIGQRLEAVRASSSVGTDLIRNEDAANDRKLEDLGIRVSRAKVGRTSDVSGHVAGREAGGRADITPGRKLQA